MVQAKISIAINIVTKELSQYSYLYALTRSNDSLVAISLGSNDVKGNVILFLQKSKILTNLLKKTAGST